MAPSSHTACLRNIQIKVVNTTVPMALNNKWITAVRFALVLAPNDAKMAVTHVPILVPSTTNSALCMGMIPAPVMVTNMAVMAADD